MILSTDKGEIKVKLRIGKYIENDNCCIKLVQVTPNKGDYGYLTTNFCERLPANYGYLDVKSVPDARRFVERYKLGRYMGIDIKSGQYMYPLYKFYTSMFKKPHQ